ncbi:hypothetical protein [Streptomyces sp. NPDC050848]|uniref:hypothetical protein n=1 Tax=Streptomyces sp. NPDC050848 TaxID=3155791 RepID=UPI0033C7FA70
MDNYPSTHVPGFAAPIPSRTNPVPPLDEELAEHLDTIPLVHPGLAMIADGLRLLAVDKLTADQTQTILTTLSGADANVLAAIGLTAQRLTNPDTNPALDTLDAQTAKDVQHLGEQFAYDLAVLHPGDRLNEAAARIDGI